MNFDPVNAPQKLQATDFTGLIDLRRSGTPLE
jgi:hypothetical protein